ncbi:MAG: CvpA family protein [Bacteroidales bacterium]|nr:CvpA family protein [Bacteroidales bacterium]
MNFIDIIIILLMLPLVIHGLSKGFISQAVGLITMIAGTILSWWVTKAIGGDIATLAGISVPAANAITFTVVFLILAIILALIGKIIRSIIRLVLLGWLDRTLGAVFAFATSVLVIGLLLIVVNALNETMLLFDRSLLEESYLYPRLTGAVRYFFPFVHRLLAPVLA